MSPLYLSALPCLAFVSVSALLSYSHYAQGQDYEKITITAARTPVALTETANSIAVIDQTSLDLVNAEHIQQTLNRVPGVNFHRNSGQEYLPAIRSPVLSGAGACGSFLMLENGIALRPNGFCNVNELFESHFEQAQQIEILRGPATAFYGSNGVHGVVNIIEPAGFSRPNALSLTVAEHNSAKLGMRASTENLAMSATIEKNNSFRNDAKVEQQKFSVQHQTEFAQTSINTYLTAFNLDQDTAGFVEGKNSYKNEVLSRQNNNPEAYRKAYGFRLHQKYQLPSGLIIKPYLRASKMDFLQHFLPGQPQEKSEQISLGVQGQQTWQLADNKQLDIGFDSEYAQTSLLQWQAQSTTGSAFLMATIPQGKQYDYQVNIFSAAPFIQLTKQVNSALKIIAAARGEYSRFSYDNQMLSGRTDENGQVCGFGGCRYSRPADRDDDFFIISPKLAAIYQINTQQSAFINISHGFRVPQSSELYRLQQDQSVADLSPEEVLGFEASWQYSADDIELNSQFYYQNKKHVILRNTEFFNVSNGETKHKGFEFSAKKLLNDVFSLLLNGSYSVHQYKNNPGLSDKNIIGNDIDSAPRKMANLFLTYQQHNWLAELQGQYSGAYFLDVENEHSYGGHFLLHGRLKHQFTQEISFAVNILNLTNKRYAERADYTSFSEERYFPGQERNISLSLNMLF